MVSRRVIAFGLAALGVGAGVGVGGEPDHGDAPQGVVGLAVAACVEAVAGDLARGRLDWGGAAERGEGGFAGEPAWGLSPAAIDQDRRGVVGRCLWRRAGPGWRPR